MQRIRPLCAEPELTTPATLQYHLHATRAQPRLFRADYHRPLTTESDSMSPKQSVMCVGRAQAMFRSKPYERPRVYGLSSLEMLTMRVHAQQCLATSCAYHNARLSASAATIADPYSPLERQKERST